MAAASGSAPPRPGVLVHGAARSPEAFSEALLSLDELGGFSRGVRKLLDNEASCLIYDPRRPGVGCLREVFFRAIGSGYHTSVIASDGMSSSRSGWPVRPSGHMLLSSTSLQHMNVNTSRCYSEIVGIHTQHHHLQFPSLSFLRYFPFILLGSDYCYSIDQ